MRRMRVGREEDPEVYKREVKAITEDEVALALNKMKNGKAVDRTTFQ